MTNDDTKNFVAAWHQLITMAPVAGSTGRDGTDRPVFMLQLVIDGRGQPYWAHNGLQPGSEFYEIVRDQLKFIADSATPQGIVAL